MAIQTPANLSNANLSKGNFTNANFFGSDLTGAIAVDAIGLIVGDGFDNTLTGTTANDNIFGNA